MLRNSPRTTRMVEPNVTGDSEEFLGDIDVTPTPGAETLARMVEERKVGGSRRRAMSMPGKNEAVAAVQAKPREDAVRVRPDWVRILAAQTWRGEDEWMDVTGRGLETLAGLEGVVGRNLRRMRMDDNRVAYLRGVPGGVMELSATGNRLSSLTSFTHLADLQWLNVSGNEMTDLEALTQLRHLRVLIADRNGLHDVSALRRMPSLARCSIRGNRVRTIDMGEARGGSLEVLDVGDNEVERMDGCEGLVGLKELILDGNRLTSFQAPNLTSLEVLRLQRNRLSQVDVSRMPRLRVLALDGNRLKELSGVEHCPDLEEVGLAEQEHATLAGVELRLMRVVRRLTLADFSKLEHLDVSSCSLRGALPKPFAKGTPNLHTLVLAHNKLTDLVAAKYMTRLRRLVVFDNEVTDFGESIRALKSLKALEELDIRYNPITRSLYAPVASLTTSTSDRDKWVGIDQNFKRTLSDVEYVRRLAYRATIIAGTGFTLSLLDGVPVLEKEKKDSERRVAKLRARAKAKFPFRDDEVPSSRSGTALGASQGSNFLDGLRLAMRPNGYDTAFVEDLARSANGSASAAANRSPFERSLGPRMDDRRNGGWQSSDRRIAHEAVRGGGCPPPAKQSSQSNSHIPDSTSHASASSQAQQMHMPPSLRNSVASHSQSHSRPQSVVDGRYVGRHGGPGHSRAFWMDPEPQVLRPASQQQALKGHHHQQRQSERPPVASESGFISGAQLDSDGNAVAAMHEWQPVSYPLENGLFSQSGRGSDVRSLRGRGEPSPRQFYVDNV
ncbi:L domain-like protein [Gonapodya prolifera JEL478]|uniref:L domain-like protein n=1 Tax=Gonapodya prolifera (strain JEL478) TaxID=1344416 RepID=A0A139A2V6_GONPJ|nr:L domain-like protein [Gonapodya prolifera JEL478]|eukprot:KXS11029.1 L domain-like protein [Gonapodya prolifera JEL478]